MDPKGFGYYYLKSKSCDWSEYCRRSLNSSIFFLLQPTTLVTKKFSKTGKRRTNVDMALPSCQGRKARAVAGAGKSLNSKKGGRGSESEMNNYFFNILSCCSGSSFHDDVLPFSPVWEKIVQEAYQVSGFCPPWLTGFRWRWSLKRWEAIKYLSKLFFQCFRAAISSLPYRSWPGRLQ